MDKASDFESEDCEFDPRRGQNQIVFSCNFCENVLSLVCKKVFELLRKEGNVLFNDALNTFYLRLYGVRHLVKDYIYI